MTAQEHIARIRAALPFALENFYKTTDYTEEDWDYLHSVNPKSMTAVLAHIDQQAAEIDRLRGEHSLAICNAAAAHDDAMRYRWLAPRLLAADFDWNETGKCVLVFDWPNNVGVGGNCDKNIDAAMKETP